MNMLNFCLIVFTLSVIRIIFSRRKEIFGRPDVKSPKEASVFLRDMAFSMGPEMCNLLPSVANVTVYGIIIEWQTNGTTITIVCNSNGDSSLYLSNGGGFIGAGQHPNVNDAAKALVAKAVTYLEKTVKTDDNTHPEPNAVVFYLLTTNGVYKHIDEMKDIATAATEWSDLFQEANNVISEIRLITEQEEYPADDI